MPLNINVRNGEIHRHESADHDVGNVVRKRLRDLVDGERRKDGNSPFNEAFSFTRDEYELLKRIKPHLFDQNLDPLTRRRYWVEFANSSEGRMFRVK